MKGNMKGNGRMVEKMVKGQKLTLSGRKYEGEWKNNKPWNLSLLRQKRKHQYEVL